MKKRFYMSRNEFLQQLYLAFEADAQFSYFCKSPFYIDDEVGDIDIETQFVEHGALCLDNLLRNTNLYHLKKYYYTFGASQPSIKYFIWCSKWASCVQIDFFAGFYVYGQAIKIELTSDIDRYRALKKLVYHNKINEEDTRCLGELTNNNLFKLFYISSINENKIIRSVTRYVGMALLALKTLLRTIKNTRSLKIIYKKLISKFSGPKVICFIGLDGAGKTTLIQGLLHNSLIKEYYEDSVTVWHTRPKILPRLGAVRLRQKKNMFSTKRNTSPYSAIKVSIIALHALVDFRIGYLHAWLRGKKLCISDRGIPEFLYQPEFAKAPKFIRTLCECQLERQHLFAIVCEASILATRKSDLDRDEIALTMESLDLFKNRIRKLGLTIEVIDTSVLPYESNLEDILRRLAS